MMSSKMRLPELLHLTTKPLLARLDAWRRWSLLSWLVGALRPIIRSGYVWWWKLAEKHYLISAAVEASKVKHYIGNEDLCREHMENEAYYHRRAAIARSNQMKGY